MTGLTAVKVAPEVFWAPRKDRIFVRIMVRDCADNYDLNISEKKILFRGKDKEGNREFNLDLDLYEEIDSKKYKKSSSDRMVKLCLNRKKEGIFWPRLLETKAKMHCVKTDFDLWQDESDDEVEDDAANWETMMNNMNIGGTEMGEEDELEDSDDDDLPDLEDDKDMEQLE